MLQTIALIAHDQKKGLMVDLVREQTSTLSHFSLIATKSTGHLIKQTTGLPVTCLLSGALGGDAQISARVAEGTVSAVIFLVDPLANQPHDMDVRALLRICKIYDVLLATNYKTACAVIESLARSEASFGHRQLSNTIPFPTPVPAAVEQ